MDILLKRSIAGEEIAPVDIEERLREVCNDVHSSCNEECPVFEKFGGIPWNKDLTCCRYFKNGKKMLEFLKK